MRRITLSALMVLAASAAFAGPPSHLPTPPLNVKITNEVLPITGEVNATLDQPVEVTGAVNVGNLPVVQAVEEINRPVFQPAQFVNTRFVEIEGPSITLLSTGVDADPDNDFPVPEGKRLVLQHVSYQMSSAGMEGQPLCAVRVLQDFDTVARHPLPLTVSEFRDEQVATVSMPITVYVDPLQTLGVSCSVRVTDDVRQSLGMTGYFVDMLP